MDTAAIPEKITSASICAALRAKYGAPAWQTFFEVGNDTGFQVKRHADAVAVGIWPSTGHAIHGFEIKVSRSDWLREKADPLKSQPIYQYCHRWYLVAPHGLVQPDELPPTWGLLAFKDGALREQVMAKKLEPQALTPGFVAALVRRAGDVDQGIISVAVEKARAGWLAESEERIEREVTLRTNDWSSERKEVREFMTRLQEAFGDKYFSTWNLKEIVPIVEAVRKSGLMSNWSGIQLIINELDRTAESIRKAFTDAGLPLEKPKKGKR